MGWWCSCFLGVDGKRSLTSYHDVVKWAHISCCWGFFCSSLMTPAEIITCPLLTTDMWNKVSTSVGKKLDIGPYKWAICYGMISCDFVSFLDLQVQIKAG